MRSHQDYCLRVCAICWRKTQRQACPALIKEFVILKYSMVSHFSFWNMLSMQLNVIPMCLCLWPEIQKHCHWTELTFQQTSLPILHIEVRTLVWTGNLTDHQIKLGSLPSVEENFRKENREQLAFQLLELSFTLLQSTNSFILPSSYSSYQIRNS